MRNEKDNLEWEVSASYYAIYFSFYAILMKCGIKCEIHSCTIELLKTYFNNYFSKDDIELFEEAKDLRNTIQYYVVQENEIKNHKKTIEKTLDFHLKCKQVALNIRKEEIEKMRNYFK